MLLPSGSMTHQHSGQREEIWLQSRGWGNTPLLRKSRITSTPMTFGAHWKAQNSVRHKLQHQGCITPKRHLPARCPQPVLHFIEDTKTKHPNFRLTQTDVRRAAHSINPRKAAALTISHGCLLRDCAHQLTEALKPFSLWTYQCADVSPMRCVCGEEQAPQNGTLLIVTRRIHFWGIAVCFEIHLPNLVMF